MVKPQYIFGSTLYKFLYIMFPSKIKLLTAKEKPINVSLQLFRTAKKSTINRQKHQLSSHYPYLPISCHAKNCSYGRTTA